MTITITYDRNTTLNTTNILNYNNSLFNLSINYINNLELGEFFGFNSNTNIYNNVSLTALIYVNYISNISVNLSVQSLYIRSRSLLQKNNYENINNNLDYSSIVQKIQIQTPPASIIYYQNDLNNRVILNNKIINEIDIYLTTNRTNTIINLKGAEWSMRVLIEEVIKPSLILDTKTITPTPPTPTTTNTENDLYNEIMNM